MKKIYLKKDLEEFLKNFKEWNIKLLFDWKEKEYHLTISRKRKEYIKWKSFKYWFKIIWKWFQFEYYDLKIKTKEALLNKIFGKLDELWFKNKKTNDLNLALNNLQKALKKNIIKDDNKIVNINTVNQLTLTEILNFIINKEIVISKYNNEELINWKNLKEIYSFLINKKITDIKITKKYNWIPKYYKLSKIETIKNITSIYYNVYILKWKELEIWQEKLFFQFPNIAKDNILFKASNFFQKNNLYHITSNIDNSKKTNIEKIDTFEIETLQSSKEKALNIIKEKYWENDLTTFSIKFISNVNKNKLTYYKWKIIKTTSPND